MDGSFQRINVVGTTGSGKTWMARRLSEILRLPCVELDALRHGPGWTETPDPAFRQRVAEPLEGDRWVVDGNCGIVRDLIWPRVNVVVFLDYPFALVMWRLLWRTLKRSVICEDLWNGNRESLRRAFASRDSILLWGLRTYWRRRRQIPKFASRSAYRHIELVRLRSPSAARIWLHGLGSESEPNIV